MSAPRLISFAGESLQTAEIRTTESTVFQPAPRNVAIVKLAQADGGVYNGGDGDLEPKAFSISGILRRDDELDPVGALDQLLDHFLYLMSKPQEIFEISHANGTRQFIATAGSPIIARERGLASAGFTVPFIAPAGVGYNVETSTLLTPTTSQQAIDNFTINVEGSYKAQPQIRVVYSVISGGANKMVSIKNGETGEGIVIQRSWQSGDVIDLDCETGDLYVNSIPVNFGGAFPEWQPSLGSLVVMDDFSTRTRQSRADYRKRWL